VSNQKDKGNNPNTITIESNNMQTFIKFDEMKNS